MKRRNVDSTKARRPIKKIPKIYDGFYTGFLVYVKLVLLLVAVMGGDFLLEFRLEYIYPIYLVIHSAYEAYKFQGVAFALLLVCIVVSVDVICLGALPAPWLYLLGSLAVWGQVGWSLTPVGPLLLIPTLIYLDGKSIRPIPSQPFSPLAAHCVGFPLVSLGFALKSFVGSKLKQRTRNDVGRQNDMLFSVLWDALPNLAPPITPSAIAPVVNNNEVITNGSAVLIKKQQQQQQQSPGVVRRKSFENGEIRTEISTSPLNGGGGDWIPNGKHHLSPPTTGLGGVMSLSPKEPHPPPLHHNHVNPSSATANLPNNNATASSSQSNATQYASPCPTCAAALLAPKKKRDDCCIKLESEVRRMRSDLHSVRSIESDLRGQINILQNSERNLRGDIALLQGEHEALQLKYSALQSKSQEERQSYEKKLLEERRQKDNAIKKQTKVTQECSGDCKRKLRDAEREKETLRRDIKVAEDKIIRLERELQNVKSTLMLEQKNKESSADTAKLVSLLSTLQDQNAHLESSLSAETRFKLDLLSALGEARRQLAIRDALLKAKDDDLEELRSKYVEILAVSDFPSHHGQLHGQLHHPSPAQPNHNHLNLRQPLQPTLQQQQQNARLKSLMGGETGQTSPENLNFSPLIES